MTGTMTITATMMVHGLFPHHQKMEGADCCVGGSSGSYLLCLDIFQDPPWRLLVNHSGVNPFHYNNDLDEWSAGCIRRLSRWTRTFLISYGQIFAGKNIPGTGLFFVKGLDVVPPMWFLHHPQQHHL
ncbi:MAG: hypothetical protein MZV70_68655 [Desulfobacterales bacterium]|nr:hypothetical protein [Desulfobacterales bacterium]